MKGTKIYTAIVLTVFACIALLFDFFPRSTFSELEKRDLKAFPAFTWESLADGTFTAAVSQWFSDTEPMRDEIMTLSMEVKGLLRLRLGEDNITFHAGRTTEPLDNEPEGEQEGAEAQDTAYTPSQINTQYVNDINAEEDAKIANAGIMIVGTGDSVRALMIFGSSTRVGNAYAEAANTYKKTFPGVNVYCMAIPTSSEFYCPMSAKKYNRPQLPVINKVYSLLDEDVTAVDVYTPLATHAHEDIYLRTDHHWSALGAYYAAQAFAQAAGAPFRDLSGYERRVVHGFVGSMYGYSGDIAIKHAPEDFVYYIPTECEYTTTYTDYVLDENFHIVGEKKPTKGPFFFHYRDGNGGAYSTFMGSDKRIVVVRTSTPGGRRLLILKDSFGNALPGYLFYSFSEIHVIDSRYFLRNMKDYVRENGITDILFANNIFNVSSGKYSRKYITMLEQHDAFAHRDNRGVKDSTTTDARRDTTIEHKDSAVSRQENGEQPR